MGAIEEGRDNEGRGQGGGWWGRLVVNVSEGSGNGENLKKIVYFTVLLLELHM